MRVRMRPLAACSVLGAMTLVLSGCPTRVPDKDGGHPTCASQPSDQLARAMFTIYYETQRIALQGTTAAALPPAKMSLEAAARVVCGQKSPDFNTRRRHAISALAAAAVYVSPTPGLTQPVEGALRTLVGPSLVDEFRVDPRFWKPESGHSREALEVHNRWVAETIIDERADSGVNLQAGRRCCVCKTAWDVDPDEATAQTSRGVATFDAHVKERTMLDMKRDIDPQSWPTCHHDYFEKVFVTAAPTCKRAENLDACKGSTPTESPKPLGSDWSGVVYEHFRTEFEPGPNCPDEYNAHVRDLLTVEAGMQGKKYQVDYGLCRSIDHKIGCAACEKRGLCEDCGFVSVEPHPSGTSLVVSAVKYLEYSDVESHPELAYALRVALIELIDVSVDDGLCCDEPGPSECAKCPEPTENVGHPPAALCRPPAAPCR